MFDEAHALKNSTSTTFQAALYMREHADMVVMMTGSPVSNTWTDTFASTRLLSPSPIKDLRDWRVIFGSTAPEGRLSSPEGVQLARLTFFLSTFIIRRPEHIINLPLLSQDTVRF